MYGIRVIYHCPKMPYITGVGALVVPSASRRQRHTRTPSGIIHALPGDHGIIRGTIRSQHHARSRGSRQHHIPHTCTHTHPLGLQDHVGIVLSCTSGSWDQAWSHYADHVRIIRIHRTSLYCTQCTVHNVLYYVVTHTTVTQAVSHQHYTITPPQHHSTTAPPGSWEHTTTGAYDQHHDTTHARTVGSRQDRTHAQ